MRILFVMPRFHTNLISWIRSLQFHKHQVEMFVLYQGGSEDYSVLSPKVFGLGIISKIIMRLSSPKEDISSQFFYGMPPLIKFIREFIRFNPDVVIIRSPNVPFGFLSCILTLFFSKRLVVYTQGPKYFRRLSTLRKLFYLLFIKIFQGVWMTPVLGNEGEKTLPWIEYVPFAVDIPMETSSSFNNNSSSVRILCVGKYELRKNHHLLLKAVSELLKKYPVQLTIAGECSRKSHCNYLNFLHEQIMKYELSNSVSLKINLPYDEIQRLYSQSHLFVLPSTRECASIANLEAMAHGLPVICSDTNGTACYTIDGFTGLLFKDQSYEDLYQCLESVISDFNLLKNMSENVRNEVSQEYSGEQFYKRFAYMLKRRFKLA